MATITPNYIQNQLFYFHNAAHKYHLDTKSYAQHKALDFLYTELESFKDTLCELLMGYLNGERLGKLKVDDVPEYSHSVVMKLVKDIKSFAFDVYEWAENKKYCDIENTAQSLSGVAAKTIYLLTLT